MIVIECTAHHHQRLIREGRTVLTTAWVARRTLAGWLKSATSGPDHCQLAHSNWATWKTQAHISVLRGWGLAWGRGGEGRERDMGGWGRKEGKGVHAPFIAAEMKTETAMKERKGHY